MITTKPLTRPASLNEWRTRGAKHDPVFKESLEFGMAYLAQPTDLFISPYSKCGTTWLQQIVHCLRTRGNMDFDDLIQVIPWLEIVQLLGIDPYAPQCGGFRVFKSHLSYYAIPKGGRYIVSFRDPKDALVSLYHFCNGYSWADGAVSLAEFARAIYLDKQESKFLSGYWEHLVSWWEQFYTPNVLLLSYEEMKADLPATIQMIADFLGLELDEELLTLAVKQASLDFMLAHKPKFSAWLYQEALAKLDFIPPSDTFTMVKTGRIGDHRTELPTDISAEMDVRWHEEVETRVGISSYQALRETLVLERGLSNATNLK
ncbi:MAG: sulfotransferase domain-containing protein [Chloroflexota bacterium]